MLLSLSLLGAAQATVFVSHLDLDEITDRADQIVIGEVSEVVSRRAPGGIVTEVTVDVFDTLLGTPASELTLTLPGGRVSGETLTVSGVPHLLVGHDLLLFLEDSRPVSFTQGIFFTDGEYAYGSERAPVAMEEVRRTVR